MHARCAGSGLLVALAASVAPAQQLSHNPQFTEVVAGSTVPVANPNGVIEPGESAHFRVSLSFHPPVGTQVGFPQPFGGVVGGFSATFFDLQPDGFTPGSWTHLAIRAGFSFSSAGAVDPITGGISTIQVGWVVPEGQTANPENPLPGVWSAVWTPASYAPRVETFATTAMHGGSSSLHVEYGRTPGGAPLYTPWSVPAAFAQVFVPIVPAPGSVVPLLLCAAALRRRAR